MIPTSDLAQQGADISTKLTNAIREDNTDLLSGILKSHACSGMSIAQVADICQVIHTCVKEQANDCLDMVLHCGANPNLEDGNMKTGLHLAAEAKCDMTTIIKTLLAHGANINQQQSGGLTPLMLACAEHDGNISSIKTLIEEGAKLDVLDEQGETCLKNLFYYEHNKYDQLFSILNVLLQAGANPNVGTQDKYLPIVQAAVNGYDNCAKTLLEYGADPFLQSGFNNLSAATVSLRNNNFMEKDSLFSSIMHKIFPEFDVHSDKLTIPAEVIVSKDGTLEKYLQSWIASVKMDASIQDNPTPPAAPSI